MFKGLSESKDFPPGKKMNDLSSSSRKHHFDIGFPEWQDSYVSATHFLHNSKPILNGKHSHENRNKSHFTLSVNENDLYFKTEKADKYRNNFDKRERNNKINKQEIMKTTFILGDDANNFVTHNQTNYYDKSRIRLPDIHWKQPQERYDIITNNDVKKEILEKACAFDYYNKNKSKQRISRNYSQIPRDNEVLNVITGKMKKFL